MQKVHVVVVGEGVRRRVRGGGARVRVAAGRGSARAHLVSRKNGERKLDVLQQHLVDGALVGEHVVVRVLLAIIRRVDGADGGRVAHLPKSV